MFPIAYAFLFILSGNTFDMETVDTVLNSGTLTRWSVAWVLQTVNMAAHSLGSGGSVYF